MGACPGPRLERPRRCRSCGRFGCAEYHQYVTDRPQSRASGSRAAADQVAAIIAAAEETAEQIRLEAERRLRERIAEGERAGQMRVDAAEEEAAEIVKQAQEQATRLREEGEQAKTAATSEALTIAAKGQESAERLLAEARAEADGVRQEAQEHSRQLLRDTRSIANDIRTEGLELVSNLHEMGGSLRSNAERLLRDVQRIHSRMVSQIDRVDGAIGGISERGFSAPRPRAQRADRQPAGDEYDPLDVPEFIPPE